MQITENSIVNAMPEDVYHNDPTPLNMEGFAEYTSLSSSVGLEIVEKTEEEARMKIHRFNPDLDKTKKSNAINLGSMVHDKVLLGGKTSGIYEVVPFKDFKTEDARNRRDDLIQRDIIPLADNQKTHQMLSDIDVMEERLREQLSIHKDWPNLMEKGAGEQSGFYFDEELQIWKRARFDWLDDIYPDIVWDYKTTSIDPKKWINNDLWKEKYIQVPHYQSVLDGVRNVKSKFGFVLQQTVEPFHVQIIVIDESYMEEVRNRYDLAQRKFANCLKTGVWRGASRYTIHATPPFWVINQWEMDEINEKHDSSMSSKQETATDSDDVYGAG